MGKSKPLEHITDMLDDLFGQWFKDKSWYAWKVLLKATFGARITKKERELFSKYTGRKAVPKNVRELWAAIGRRGGKSRIAGVIAVILAFFTPWDEILAPGEKGYIVLIYPDRKQGRVTMSYIRAFIDARPMFAKMVKRRTADTLYLTNGIVIEIATCNFRTIRGYTVVAAICDEIAFWRSEESANPDYEILTALRPAMSTVANSLLICISSPYARRGELWKAYQKHYGKEDDNILVWQADTRSMNPTVPQSVIDRAFEEDPISASAEYGAEFRRDIEGFVTQEAVQDVVAQRLEIEPIEKIRYFGFVDQSGGSQDSMTLAIAHNEKGIAVLDAIREHIPPFSPKQVVKEFCDLLKSYRITQVTGDRYGGEWPREVFRDNGVQYRTSDKTKSDLYVSLLPAINSQQCELLNNKRLISQLCNLERRTVRSGKDSVDHGPGGRDDVANAVAGAIVLAANKKQQYDWSKMNLFGYEPLGMKTPAHGNVDVARGWMDPKRY